MEREGGREATVKFYLIASGIIIENLYTSPLNSSTDAV